MKRLIGIILGVIVLLAGSGLGFVWFACRVYVQPDEMLVLVRKTGAAMPADQKIAEEGQKGIQRTALGPGRYFFNPYVWDWEKHKLIDVPAGDPATWLEVYRSQEPSHQVPTRGGSWPKVGVVTSLAGKKPEVDHGVVDAGYQGIQRAVLTPGTYRLNPLAYKVELRDAVVVPLGCCGVVTSLLGDMPGEEVVVEALIAPGGETVEGEQKVIQKLAKPGQRGVLKDILPPGLYYLNPYEFKVTIVQVGYNDLAALELQEVSDPIRFPSRDGYTIHIGVNVVWGRHPEHASKMIARFGEVDKLEQILLGQIRSICRNIGSEYQSTDFIRGEPRERYQTAVTQTLQQVAKERDIEILIALIQNIEVHGSATAGADEDLKETIQAQYIAAEEKLTGQRKLEAARAKADLETALVAIDVAREEIAADTRKKKAEILAEGNKRAEEIDALRALEVARIEKKIAELDAQRTLVLGRAGAQVEELRNQAEAAGKAMMVQAFGSGQAYNLYTFAEGFAPESIRLIFAGEGTFWTDLQRLQDVAALELLRSTQPAQPRP